MAAAGAGGAGSSGGLFCGGYFGARRAQLGARGGQLGLDGGDAILQRLALLLGGATEGAFVVGALRLGGDALALGVGALRLVRGVIFGGLELLGCGRGGGLRRL